MNKKIIFAIALSMLIISCANKKDDWMASDPLIFLNVTNGEDTCLTWTFPSSLYYELNIKCMPELDLYKYIDKIIEKKQVMVVSDDYFLMCQDYAVTRSYVADSINTESGIEGLVRYIEKNPPILADGDIEAFLWAAYILWENNILVASGDEDPSWYTIKRK